MANCIYCDQPAGLFHHSHPACRDEAKSIYDKAGEDVLDYLVAGTCQPKSITEIARTTHLKLEDGEIHNSIVARFAQAADRVLEDGLLSREAEDRAAAVIDKYELSDQELEVRRLKTKLAKSAVLRDLMNRIIPHRFKMPGCNLILGKGESIIWAFPNVHVRELKRHREYHGSSQGYSIRLFSGVYYRVSGFRGVPVDTQSYDSIGVGVAN